MNLKTTNHLKFERQNRIQILKSKIGFGFTIKVCEFNKGHKDGSELHLLTSTGLIFVFNARTLKWVTVLVARPQQIRRFYYGGNAPQYLLDIATEHIKKGYNFI